MPAPRQISMIQITVMLTYIEKYKIGINPSGRSIVDLKKEREHWIKMTKLLNKCPGAVRDARKWREFWNDLKYISRLKSSKGRKLRPHEQKALHICGAISNKQVIAKVSPVENALGESSSVNCNGTLETHEDTNAHLDNDEPTMEQDEQSIITEIIPTHVFDPMSTTDVIDTFIHNNPEEEITLNTDTTENIQEPRIKEEDTSSHQEAHDGDVPDWVRRVEHSRLSFESRTTEAVEKMSEGITSMASAMQSLAGSLMRIEKVLQSSNCKKCDCQNT